MSRRTKDKPDHRRTAIANEAARLIQEHALADFRTAKHKAVDKLGFKNDGSLPSNGEIERALTERNRIFHGDSHLIHLQRLRESAMEIMRSLESFNPRLVGPVLSGSATEHSAIDLHLFSDAAEEVGVGLDTLGIAHRSVQHRHRFSSGEIKQLAGFRFYSGEYTVSATVFSLLQRHHAPCSPIDGKPMQRAKLRDVALLIENSQKPKSTRTRLT